MALYFVNIENSRRSGMGAEWSTLASGPQGVGLFHPTS
jgi:hypothetical protein